MIPYGRQNIDENDIQGVTDVLRSDFLTQGPTVPAFEKAIADYCDVNYAIAVNSATSALHIACLALDVRPGDIVWTSPITFVASANCALYCGADIDFVDIDSNSYNMSIDCLSSKLQQAKKVGRLPKVVIPVHFSGQSCDMKAINTLSREYGFNVIEDASHAIGGKYNGKSIGNCEYSDITVFSFHPVKIITTGEGGMAVTNVATLAKRMQSLRSHGITRNEKEMTHISHGPWYYEQIDLGYNYRMTDLQAALGLSQMKRLDHFVSNRHAITKKYNQLLADLPVKFPWQNENSYSSFHLYVIRLNLSEIKKTHVQVFEELRDKKIGVNLHYIPVYLHPFYKKLGFNPGYCLEAEKYYGEAISLPIYSEFTEVEQKLVAETLKKIITL